MPEPTAPVPNGLRLGTRSQKVGSVSDFKFQLASELEDSESQSGSECGTYRAGRWGGKPEWICVTVTVVL
eukprot:3621398-Rhodomonas_salina.1